MTHHLCLNLNRRIGLERLFELSAEDKEKICQISAENLRTLRTLLGWQLGELADTVGTTRRRLSEIERGCRRMPWTMFLALTPIFALNPRTRNSSVYKAVISDEVIRAISGGWHERDVLFDLLEESENLARNS